MPVGIVRGELQMMGPMWCGVDQWEGSMQRERGIERECKMMSACVVWDIGMKGRVEREKVVKE